MSLLATVSLGAQADEPDQRYDWSIGAYGGVYSDSNPADLFLDPIHPEIKSNYIAALTASVSLYHFESIPLAIELDGFVARRFGDDNFFEFGALPVVRWEWFPWNQYVLTNVRFGPVGASYTTGISKWEVSAPDEGSHFLNYMMAELTLASPDSVKWETFIRFHHRSSIFGLINDFNGNGTDFLTAGFRRKF